MAPTITNFVQCLFPFTKVSRHYNQFVDRSKQDDPIASAFGIRNLSNNIDYLKGEVDEFVAEVDAEKATGKPNKEKIQDELGDVLYSATVAGHSAGVDPNLAMVNSLQKVRRRLQDVEQQEPKPQNKSQFKILWEKAKKRLG